MPRPSNLLRRKLSVSVPALLLALGVAGTSGCATRKHDLPPTAAGTATRGGPILALQPGQFRVCAFGFNSPHELTEIKPHLSANRFAFTDLTPVVAPADATALPLGSAASALGRSRPGWLLDLCRSDLRCDVVIYSGEFAGGFFGEQGISLTVQEMEEASCRPQCRGLFHDPREVFLLGCNTLATKSADSRTPEQYLEVLMEHGFSRSDAERAVELRYGPLGPSFKESLRRIFSDVPRIYGFTTVAPRGEKTAPRLNQYFKRKGDYAKYLERSGRDAAANKELRESFKGMGLTQTAGLMPQEAASADRALVCQLYDEDLSLEKRLRTVKKMFTEPAFLAFVPTIEVFFRRHPPEAFTGDERRTFAEIQSLAAPRRELLALTQRLTVSAQKFQMATLARQLGWMTPGEYDQLAAAGVRDLLAEPLSPDVADIGCELSRQTPAGSRLRSEEIPEQLLWHAEGYRWLDCLAPTDPRLSTRMLTGLGNIDEGTRVWAAYALSRRLPLDDSVLIALAPRLQDSAAGVRERVRAIFVAEAPLSAPVLAAVRERDPALAKSLQASAVAKDADRPRPSPRGRAPGSNPLRR